jgi:hypothetical protein
MRMHLPCLDAPAQAEGKRTWDSWNNGRSGDTVPVEAKTAGWKSPAVFLGEGRRSLDSMQIRMFDVA